MFYIYELVDPDTGITGYIGMTVNPDQRYRQHLSRKDNNNDFNRKKLWIEKILYSGKKPRMNILEIVDTMVEARTKEKYWVNFYVQQGIPLTNQRPYPSQKLSFHARYQMILDNLDKEWEQELQKRGYPKDEKLEKLLEEFTFNKALRCKRASIQEETNNTPLILTFGWGHQKLHRYRVARNNNKPTTMSEFLPKIAEPTIEPVVERYWTPERVNQKRQEVTGKYVTFASHNNLQGEYIPEGEGTIVDVKRYEEPQGHFIYAVETSQRTYNCRLSYLSFK